MHTSMSKYSNVEDLNTNITISKTSNRQYLFYLLIYGLKTHFQNMYIVVLMYTVYVVLKHNTIDANIANVKYTGCLFQDFRSKI